MQLSMFSPSAFVSKQQGQFPSTRYQGSKAKLVEWIWNEIEDLEFHTCLDAFGGTAAVAYRLKQAGKQVTYNDSLRFNYYFGLALIENKDTRLTTDDMSCLLTKHSNIAYPAFIADTFQDIYFTNEENAWIDQTITNIRQLDNPYKQALAFFALSQACIIKRPFNLFHRKNLYIRFADVDRSFGNKTSWDKPFDQWFRVFVDEVNNAIFDNSQDNHACNCDVFALSNQYDLVYIDTPYISSRGISVDFLGFYHFLEGLTMYDTWGKHIDFKSKHRRLKPQPNEWIDKKTIHSAFDRLFNQFRESKLVVSYRSDGIPSEIELISILRRYKNSVRVKHYGHYKYALSTNSESKEILIIAE